MVCCSPRRWQRRRGRTDWAVTRSRRICGDLRTALADAELKRIDEASGAAFDAKKADFEAKAREQYMVDRDKYTRPEEVRFSDIAVAIKDRGDDAARKRVEEARQRLLGRRRFRDRRARILGRPEGEGERRCDAVRLGEAAGS